VKVVKPNRYENKDCQKMPSLDAMNRHVDEATAVRVRVKAWVLSERHESSVTRGRSSTSATTVRRLAFAARTVDPR
jgi:hypothetical protein